MPSPYATIIARHSTYDPRHVEAYMRVEHGTLDGLSDTQFRAEVGIANQCIEQGGVEMAEKLAQSYGL